MNPHTCSINIHSLVIPFITFQCHYIHNGRNPKLINILPISLLYCANYNYLKNNKNKYNVLTASEYLK